MRQCADLMNTEVSFCLPTATVLEVARMMRLTKDKYIPVVADGERRIVVGSVSVDDLLEHVLCEGRNSTETSVAELLGDKIITCSKFAPIDLVLARMSEFQLTEMPVVDEVGVLLGVISLSDIADYYKCDCA